MRIEEKTSQTDKNYRNFLKKSEHQTLFAGTEGLSGIKPPVKANPFKYYSSSRAAEKLQESIQHSWWLTGTDTFCQALVESERMEANFAQLYSYFVNKECNHLLHYVPASTVTELHAMRELIWMFHMPQRCTMFNLDTDNHITMRNFTLPSVTINGLRNFLEKQFFPYIEMMNYFRCFRDDIYNYHDRLPSKTIECYTAQLHLLLKPVWEKLLAFEEKLIISVEFSINTLIQLRQEFDSIFKHLYNLYDLHRNVVLNWKEQPAHICSAYLLASLIYNYQNSCDISKAHIAISLLLGSMKVFCEIIDTWWLEGRLDDCRNEFIVERYLKYITNFFIYIDFFLF